MLVNNQLNSSLLAHNCHKWIDWVANSRPSLFKFCSCLPIRKQFFQIRSGENEPTLSWLTYILEFMNCIEIRAFEGISNFRNDLSKELGKCKCNLGQLFWSNFHLVSVCNPYTVKSRAVDWCTIQFWTILAKGHSIQGKKYKIWLIYSLWKKF